MIVVNYSSSQYYRAQDRLVKSIGHNHSSYLSVVSPFPFRDLPLGCPAHSESPYEFKVHCINKVKDIDPIVLWADSSMYCVGDLSKIEDIIKNDGFFGQEAGHYVGDWCNDHTRAYFNLTEEENKIPMFSAGLLGLNMHDPLAQEFMDQWEASAKAGCFKGDWSNHRHDMTCASIIAHRLRFKLQRGGSTMAYIGPGYSTPEPGVVFYCQGMI